MLKKLLKYDFNAIFKYWWIGAITTFILSFVGYACEKVIYSPKDLPESVYIFATLGVMLVVLSYVVFAFITALLVYIRFYKHLFSDEGYLTFTLPVKRNQILSSKLITGCVATLLTAIVTIINTVITFLPLIKDDFFYRGWEKDFEEAVNNLITAHGIFNLVIEAVEILLIVVTAIILITLFTYLCITVGCIVSKKAKLASAIGIYYGSSSLATVFIYLFYFFGANSLGYWMSKLPNEQNVALIPVLLLLVVFITLMLCTLIYTLINWLIDRKLNLN